MSGVPAKPTAPGASPMRSAFARGVRNNVLAEFGVQALRFGWMIVLARALRPQDFGVFKVLLIVGSLAALTTEAGLPEALVQREELTSDHEATAWWLNFGLALLIAGVLYEIAPVVGRVMAMPELDEGVRLICIPILLEGTAMTSRARLQRRLSFGWLAMADVLAESAFIAVALWLLWINRPELSLAGGLAARYATHAITLWCIDLYVPDTGPSVPAARDLGRFAGTVFGGRGIYAVSSNLDFILVGRLLGSSALGFYSMAWDLLRFVPGRLHRVAGTVSFPAFCRMQDDGEKLRRVYREFFSYLARLVLPIMVCGAIAAPELMRTVYGPQWMPAVTPLRLLAVGLSLAGLRIAIGPIYLAKNRPSFDILLHGGRCGLVAMAVFIAAAGGLFGVSAAMSAV
ncbi:MAG: oligosaccharide flippase family protein, partial [Candidatus Binataceae bacterium]